MQAIKYLLSTQFFKDFITRLFKKSPKFFVSFRWFIGLLGSLVTAAYYLNESGTINIPTIVIDNIKEILITLGSVFAGSFFPVDDNNKNLKP